MLCKILEKRRSHLLHGRSLKSSNLGPNFSLRQAMPRLLPHMPRFNFGPVHVGFIVDVALWQVCLWLHSALILLPAPHSYFTHLPPTLYDLHTCQCHWTEHVSILTSWRGSQSVAVLQLWGTDKFRTVSPHRNYVCVTADDQIITSEKCVIPTTITMTHTKQQIFCATSHLHWINSLLNECLIHTVINWSSVPLAQRVLLPF